MPHRKIRPHMRIALSLVSALVALSACSAKTPTVTAPAVRTAALASASMSSPTDAELATPARGQDFLAPFLRTATETRGLAPLFPVLGERVDRAGMLAVVRAHVDAEVPAEDIAREEIELALYGLIPPDYNYKEGFFKLLESELAGVYIPTDKKLYYSSDLGGGESETIVHELTHALQDQHFHLGDRMESLQHNDDAGFAMQVLAEGDATFTGIRTEITKRMGSSAPAIPVPQLRAMMDQGVASSMAKIDAPPAMKRMLAAPYIEGVSFVGALFEEGGWARVNEAWGRPPTSSHQALDVHRWAAQAAYLTLSPARAPAGFSVAHAGASGEYGVRALWEQWAPKEAAALAKLARGDIDALYTNSQSAHAVMSVVDTSSDVVNPKRSQKYEISANHQTLLAALFKQKGWSNDGLFHCLQRPSVGPFAITVAANHVRISAGPATKAQTGWSSTTTCNDVKKWHAAAAN